MRFGIMTMQKNLLAPVQVSGDVLAQMSAFDHAALAGRLAECGFDLIELSGDLVLFFPGAFSPDTVARLAALKADRGLSYTVHLPLWSVEPSTPLLPVREGSVRAVIETIRATASLEPEAYVLHATGALAAEFYRMDLPEQARALILRLFQQQAGTSIATILSETGIPSRKLALETVEFPLDLTLELAERFDTGICLDTGHILAGFAGRPDLFAALEAALPRLAEVHLHDSPRQRPDEPPAYGRDHRSLGTGDLDLTGLLDRLAAAGYDGPIVLELTVEEALASLEVVRQVRPGVL